MTVNIVNRSTWPTWLVKWLVRRACRDAGVRHYTMTVKPGRNKEWGGRGGSYTGSVWCKRRALKALHATFLYYYYRYKPENSCHDHIPHTSVALLAFIIRHEVEHAKQAHGHPSSYVNARTGRTDQWLMEMHCNEMGANFVNALTENFWRETFPEWRKLARREQARARKQKPPTDVKLAKRRAEISDRLAVWQRKHKLAATKMKKYAAALRRLDGRIAACHSPEKAGHR